MHLTVRNDKLSYNKCQKNETFLSQISTTNYNVKTISNKLQ